MKHLFFIALLICSSNAFGQIAFRQNVKCLTDGFKPEQFGEIVYSVDDLQKFTETPITKESPRLEKEHGVVVVAGKITNIIEEPDGEMYIEIRGFKNDSTILCELIDPENATAKESAYSSLFTFARKAFGKLKIGYVVTVTGVLFQYGQQTIGSDKQLTNHIGICPVLKIEMGEQDPMVDPKSKKL